jgi:hypothetical protein
MHFLPEPLDAAKLAKMDIELPYPSTILVVEWFAPQSPDHKRL